MSHQIRQHWLPCYTTETADPNAIGFSWYSGANCPPSFFSFHQWLSNSFVSPQVVMQQPTDSNQIGFQEQRTFRVSCPPSFFGSKRELFDENVAEIVALIIG
jgi:hypothetical protein